MEKILGFCIQVPNVPGSLSKVTNVLAKNKINIIAIVAPEANDFGLVRIFTDNFDKAKNALDPIGFPFSLEEAYSISLPDKEGALNELLQKFSLYGINIDYIFSTTSKNGNNARVVLSFNDKKRGEEILKEFENKNL